MFMIKSNDGVLLAKQGEIQKLSKEHFLEVFNCPEPWMEINVDAPTKAEIYKALKERNSRGVDSLTDKILKAQKADYKT